MARINREYKIHSSTLSICFGDITTSSAEVIVSSDDTLCTMGGGVSGAIKRAGGANRYISLAVSGRKRILPVRLDDTPYAKCIRYDLSDIDWIDYTLENHDSVMQKFRLCIQMYLQGTQS